MGTALFTCFGTVVGLVGAVLLFVFVLIPLIGHVFTFVGRIIRFVFQEMCDSILLAVALFVCVIKLLRATLCVVLARWDIVHLEIAIVKRRSTEVWNRIVSILIDNPLRLIGIDSPAPALLTQVIPTSTPKNQFEGYEITGTLPMGGSGAKLFVAKQLSTQSYVAIKCFTISTGSQLPQIVRESRAMEAAKKLGLVIEHHLDNEHFWYATPYHAGHHLGVVTNKLHHATKTLSEAQLQTILSYQHSLLQTLCEYHSAGLWHKDVKPDNIIIHDGSAHLVDLGLVTPLASAMTLTTHGTEYFRDPELVRQAMRGVKVHQVDGSKFDVFGAGAVLYFMLENTFPAHGGLSDFSKESPDCIRWVIRRAMADYDKRYSSVEEMLLDIETILSAKHVSGVRPADLPSMNGETTKTTVRRLPAKSTPSTGGGPFEKKQKKNKLSEVIFMLIILAVCVRVFTKKESPAPIPESRINLTEVPTGAVLVVNELTTSHNSNIRKEASNKIAEISVAGWELFVNEDKEASVRSWLPINPVATPIPAGKLEKENISGILFIQEGEGEKPTIYFVDQNGAYLFP